MGSAAHRLGQRVVVIESIRVLLGEGVTLESAVRAAAVLDRGGSIGEARELLELAPVPVQIDAELLVAAVARASQAIVVEARR